MLGGFGFHQKPLDTVEMFSPNTDTWSQLPVKQFFKYTNFSYEIIYKFNLKSHSQKSDVTLLLLRLVNVFI